MLVQVFQYHNDQMQTLVGIEYAPATVTRFKMNLEHTKAFLQ